jgi:hypothetical protein
VRELRRDVVTSRGMRIIKKGHLKGESERVKEGSSNLQENEDNENETCDGRE